MSDFIEKSREFSQMLLDAEVDEAINWARRQIDAGISPLDFLTKFSHQPWPQWGTGSGGWKFFYQS